MAGWPLGEGEAIGDWLGEASGDGDGSTACDGDGDASGDGDDSTGSDADGDELGVGAALGLGDTAGEEHAPKTATASSRSSVERAFIHALDAGSAEMFRVCPDGAD